MFLVLYIWSLTKNELWFFLLNFLSKFIDMYCMDTVLSLILLVFEMLKIPKTKVEAHFLKKLDFVTNMFGTRCLWKMFKDNRQPFKIHSITAFTMHSYVQKFSYYLVYSTKLSQYVSYIS